MKSDKRLSFNVTDVNATKADIERLAKLIDQGGDARTAGLDAINRVHLKSKVDALLESGAPSNTLRSYESDLRHFEKFTGRALPAPPQDVELYLAHYCDVLNPRTLSRRVAALSYMHRSLGYDDPTKTKKVALLLRAIRNKYGKPARQAKPLGSRDLAKLMVHTALIGGAGIPGEAARQEVVRHRVALRDRLLFLMGFLCGQRSDELVRLRFEGCRIQDNNGRPELFISISSSKTDRDAHGKEWTLVAAPNRIFCPVMAWLDWVDATGLRSGPVFRAINQWGTVSETGLHPNSVIKLMRSALSAAGIAEVDTYSSHSLRRGFASAWNEHGGDLKSLMEWVGWKNPAIALQYQSAVRNPPALLINEWMQEEWFSPLRDLLEKRLPSN